MTKQQGGILGGEKLTRVELQLVSAEGEDPFKICNLIGMNETMICHANLAGEVYIGLTERVRVIGEGFDQDDPKEVYKLLDRPDIQVFFMKRAIFHDQTWGAAMVQRFLQEISSLD